MKKNTVKKYGLQLLLGISLVLLNTTVKTATPITTIEDQKRYFYKALKEIKLMLEGKIPMSYERAIFIMENAYWEGNANYETYQAVLDAHLQSIQYLIKANDHRTDFTPKSYYPNEEELRVMYKKALANEAIFHYMTDTNYYLTNTNLYKTYPFTYPFHDPLGIINWENAQVLSMLSRETQRGNCFALTSLFKIFSDRLASDAILCTAPGHIYIRHEDENGIRFNVELATKSFPGTGSMQTLTYTLNEAIVNGIALRNLTDKGEITLTLIYLAKSYQQKFNIVEDDFMLDCAETALKYDDLSLNAMLLKAEILEERIIQQQKTIDQLRDDALFQNYEQFIVNLYKLGYREMPTEMKNIILAGMKGEPLPIMTKDHTPKAFVSIESGANGYMTLSGGLFEEVHIPKSKEKYSRTVLDTKTKKITRFEDRDTLYNNYPMDAVVFALSIDPLAKKFPDLSPYSAFANNPILFVDSEGDDVEAYNARSQDLVIKTLSYVFGQNNGFSFEKNKLVHNGDVPQDLTPQQTLLFIYFKETLIKSNTLTTVRINQNISTKINSEGERNIGGVVQDGEATTFYYPETRRNRNNGKLKAQTILSSTRAENQILITSGLLENGIDLDVENEGIRTFTKEHAVLHEFGHAILKVILNEMRGQFNGINFNELTEEQRSDFAIRFTNTLLQSQGKSLETGLGQHGRKDNEVPESSPQPLRK